jgi:predicted nucleotidyltransferase
MAASVGTFDIWLRREAAKREAAESVRRRTLERLAAWLDSNAARFGVGRVAIFGSITRPYGFGARSDIDLALSCGDARLRDLFASAVEQDIGRAVDTVPLDECRFAPAIAEEAVWWTPLA